MAHPPPPGPTVRPNFLAIMEAISDITFPISKRDLLDQLGDDTVLFQGTNFSLHDLVKDIHDDQFATDAEFLDALENLYTPSEDEEPAAPERASLRAPGEDPWKQTERAGPIESGRGAMVRSDRSLEGEE